MNLSELKVLVIDDLITFRTLLHDILKSAGIKDIYLASDGEEGLMSLVKANPDAVILDWEMPKCNGLEFTRMVRKSEMVPNRNVPIIMCTTHSDLDHIREAKEAGINDYIRKPFKGKDVIGRLELAMKKQKTQIKK